MKDSGKVGEYKRKRDETKLWMEPLFVKIKKERKIIKKDDRRKKFNFQLLGIDQERGSKVGRLYARLIGWESQSIIQFFLLIFQIPLSHLVNSDRTFE